MCLMLRLRKLAGMTDEPVPVLCFNLYLGH